MALLMLVVLVMMGGCLIEVQSAITLQQMMDAGKLMRQSCQPKFKLNDEIADGIRAGNIPDNKDVKCYINCILEMTKSMKKGKYQHETALKQVETMVPDDMKDEYRNAITICKDAGQGTKNPCDASYAILKCFVENAPRFVFP